jgi:hypothetical protein
MSPPFTWEEASRATSRDDGSRQLPSAQCSLCGITASTGLMVPDGGQACLDVRWYCQDAQACTERWTASLPGHAPIAPTPPTVAASREAPAGGKPIRPALPDPAPADLRAQAPEEAWSVDPP